MTNTAVALPFTSGKTTKQWTVRSPFLTLTHSWCRGDLVSRSLKVSCACTPAVRRRIVSSVQTILMMDLLKGLREPAVRFSIESHTLPNATEDCVNSPGSPGSVRSWDRTEMGC